MEMSGAGSDHIWRKRIRIQVAGVEGLRFELVLIEGAEPGALNEAVKSRVGGGLFFLTSPNDSGLVMPLTWKLPDGLELTLHRLPGLEPTTTLLPAPVDARDSSPAVMEAAVAVTPTAADAPTTSTTPAIALATAVPPSPVMPTTAALTTAGFLPPEMAPLSPRLGTPLLQTSGLSASSDSGNCTPIAEDEPIAHCRIAQPTRRLSAPTFRRSATHSSIEQEQARGRATNRRGSLARIFSRSRSSELVEHSHTAAQITTEMCTSVERFSRLTTDLANERTLLAWMRTCMASIRTVFAYFAIVGTSNFFQGGVVVAEISMATLVLFTAIVGHARYTRMKCIIQHKVPPANFGRISTRYLWVLIVLASTCTSVSVYMRKWEIEKE